jgi:hypothetical protein
MDYSENGFVGAVAGAGQAALVRSGAPGFPTDFDEMKSRINEQYQRLRDSIPERAVPGADAVFVGAQTLRGWLERLPLANPGLAISRLAALLKEMNAARLEPRERLQALEVLRMPIHDLTDSLNRQLQGEAFPMRAAKVQAGQVAQDFMTDLAIGYIEVICDQCTATGTVPFLRGKMVSLALTRAIQYQGARLYNAYLMHVAPASGVWQSLHDLFRFAQKVGRDAAADADPVDGGVKISARAAYIQALLHAFAKPYQFTQGEIAELHLALPVLADLCDISPGFAMSGAIAVVTDGDHVPSETPRARRAEIANQWMLDVSRLLEMLDLHLEALHPGARSMSLLTRSGEPLQLSVGLVTRLVKIWKARCARAHPRTADHSIMHTLVGMQAVHYNVSGNVDFAAFRRKAYSDSPVPSDKSEGEIWSHPTHSQDLAIATRAAAIDRSVGGCRLRWDKESGVRARVSEIIALASDEPGAVWTIGILRWLRADAAGGVDVGVETLPARTLAVSLRGLDAAGVAGAPLRGLLMLPDPHHPEASFEAYVIASHLFDRDVSAVEMTRLDDAQQIAQIDRISEFRILDRGGEYLDIVLPDYPLDTGLPAVAATGPMPKTGL